MLGVRKMRNAKCAVELQAARGELQGRPEENAQCRIVQSGHANCQDAFQGKFEKSLKIYADVLQTETQ